MSARLRVRSRLSKQVGSCSAKRGFAPGLPSSSRSVPARADGVFRYVRLPRFAEALFFSGQFVFVYFGDFFEHASLVWERLVVQPWLQYILFYCLSFYRSILSLPLFPFLDRSPSLVCLSLCLWIHVASVVWC